MDRFFQSRPAKHPRPVREGSSVHDPDDPTSSYDRGYPPARQGGRRSSVIPMSMSRPQSVPDAPFSGSSSSSRGRRPRMSRRRSGSGCSCAVGDHTREYDPVVERPQRDPYGVGARRRTYDVDELDDE